MLSIYIHHVAEIWYPIWGKGDDDDVLQEKCIHFHDSLESLLSVRRTRGRKNLALLLTHHRHSSLENLVKGRERQIHLLTNEDRSVFGLMCLLGEFASVNVKRWGLWVPSPFRLGEFYPWIDQYSSTVCRRIYRARGYVRRMPVERQVDPHRMNSRENDAAD